MPFLILLVESDVRHAQAMADAVREKHVQWHLELAQSLAEAREVLATAQPEAIIAGHLFSDGDVFDLWPDIAGKPAIVCVAPGEEAAAARALRAGFADFLVKDDALGYLQALPALLDAVLRRCDLLRRLGDSAERYEVALAGADLGLWDHVLSTGANVINPRWSGMLGYAPDELAFHGDAWLALVHPDDREPILRANEACLRAGPGEAGRYDAEFRMRHRDGRWIWVQSRGKVVERDADGAPLRLAGTHLDITESRSASDTLLQQHRLMQAISRAHSLSMGHGNDASVFTALLADLLALTDSGSGFIAEVLPSIGETPALAVHAVAGVAGAEAGEPLPAPLQALAQTVCEHPGPLILAPAAAPPEGEPGAPELQAFLGIPVSVGTELVALVGFGNRAEGYRPEDAHFLEPLLSTLGPLVRGRRIEGERRLAQVALARTSQLLSSKSQMLEDMLNSISQGISLVDGNNRLVAHNARYRELLDLPASLLAGHPNVEQIVKFQSDRGDFGETFELVEADARSYVASECESHGAGAHPPEIYLRRTRTGRVIEVKTRQLAGGARSRTFTDVTTYFDAQSALRESEARFRSLNELVTDWYWEQDESGRFIRSYDPREREPSLPGLQGQDAAQVAGAGAGPDHAIRATAEQWQQWNALIAARRPFRDVVLPVEVAGTPGLRYFSMNGLPVLDEQGAFRGYRGTGRDVTEHKLAEAEIERLAFYDALSSLPNRRLLIARLGQALAASARSGRHGALLFIDLDNFKDLNDTLGHDVGDALLAQVARRLVACVREADTVARFGGDEFVVMLEDLSSEPLGAAEQAEAAARKILAALNLPYELQEHERHSTPSIGIALFQDYLQSVDELLKRADLAMYQAKAAGRNTLRFFASAMQEAVADRATLEADLRQCLARQELKLLYQPVVDEAQRVTGAEALLRWNHPLRGLVSPGLFIPLAEQTGIIVPLGQWVLEAACRQLAAWAGRAETAGLTISVNVSARQFRQPDFVAQVAAALAQAGADAARLELEITESMLLADVREVIEKMGELKALGVGFALDDFGTGYSSLAYLRKLPLDKLKIDQSFVREVLGNPNDAAIARTILALARSLDLGVVAEGVETDGQHSFLLRNGCKAFQGYLFGRPGEPGAIEEMVKAEAG